MKTRILLLLMAVLAVLPAGSGIRASGQCGFEQEGATPHAAGI